MVNNSLVLTDAMIVSAAILVVTFLGIFSEHVHGMERAKFATAGAAAMIIFGQIYGFYSPELAIAAVDWNVIFLLGCMMMIISIMIPTGGFEVLAYRIARLSRARLCLLLMLLGCVVTIVSLLLDNVTTVVIFGPLIVLIARAQKISPIPYLMAAALLTDVGGVATLIGDPPNLMIGSAAGIDFNTFIGRMWMPVLAATVSILIFLKWMFRKELKTLPPKIFHEKAQVTNKKVWIASLLILACMVVLFTIHTRLGWEPWFIAAIGMAALVSVSRNVVIDRVFEDVEVTLLIFFISLFMVVGGVGKSGLLDYLGHFITPFAEHNLLTATIVLMWGVAILSAFIDNILITGAMIPIILQLQAHGINVTPLWWALAVGVGMGGNGTYIGSTANVFIVSLSERISRQQDDTNLAITPGVWFRKGTPAMILTLIVSSIIMAAFFDSFAAPLH